MDLFAVTFVIVVLQKHFTLIKGDANDDLIFSRLLIYEYSGVDTGVS